MDLSDEEAIRNVIREVAKVANRPLDKAQENRIVKDIMKTASTIICLICCKQSDRGKSPFFIGLSKLFGAGKKCRIGGILLLFLTSIPNYDIIICKRKVLLP